VARHAMTMAATTPMTMPAIAPPDRELGEGLSLEGPVEFVAVAVCVEVVCVEVVCVEVVCVEVVRVEVVRVEVVRVEAVWVCAINLRGSKV
jgi:hypothetical protein